MSKVVRVNDETYDLACEMARIMAVDESRPVQLAEIFSNALRSYSVTKLRTNLLHSYKTTNEFVTELQPRESLEGKKIVPSNGLLSHALSSLNSPEIQDSLEKENPLKGVKEKESRPARKASKPAWESPDWWKPIEALDGYKPGDYGKYACRIAEACAREGVDATVAATTFAEYYRVQKARNGWTSPVRPFETTLHITIRDILRQKGGTNGRTTRDTSANESSEDWVAIGRRGDELRAKAGM